jgi:uncharacterized protein YbaA (DUF1428 family)
MSYIDGFVIPVPQSKRQAYEDLANSALPLFKRYDAVRVVENWGDDVPDGKLTDFRRAVKAEADEVVVFSWVIYPDRAARDACNKAMMEAGDMGECPFDPDRMIYGSFEPICEAGPGGVAGYVDGTLIAVATARREEFKAYAQHYVPIFLEHGATRMVDGWGDDVPEGTVTSYRGAVNATADETVVFSWVEWPSKAVRDEAWRRIEKDPRMRMGDAPFDLARMVFGGFATLLDG